MATTFGLNLASHPDKEGNIPIYIRITQNRKSRRIITSVTIRKKSDWNPNAKNSNWIRSSDIDSEKKNETLKLELEAVQKEYEAQKKEGAVSIAKVTRKVKGADVSPNFVEYAQAVTDELKAKGDIRSAKKYQDFTNKMRAYRPRVTFADIDTEFIHKFETHLLTLPNQRHPDQMLSVSAVQVQLKTFRAILNRAKDINKLITVNPFDSFKIHQGEKPVKAKLTKEELDAINALELEVGSLIWHTRNAFMLSFYCAGIRAGDLVQLRWNNVSHDGRISYVMDKNGKIRNLILVRQAKEIIALYDGVHEKNDYIFPFLDKSAPWFKYVTHEQRKVMPVKIKEQLYAKISSVNTILNKYLGKMEDMAGLEKHISFHVSRHSFAYQASRNDVDSLAIKKALAHTSLQTTETYLGELNDSETDTVLQRMFDDKPDKEKVIKELLAFSDEEFKDLLKEVRKQRKKKEQRL
jgi:site-specific recombinase XerD